MATGVESPGDAQRAIRWRSHGCQPRSVGRRSLTVSHHYSRRSAAGCRCRRPNTRDAGGEVDAAVSDRAFHISTTDASDTPVSLQYACWARERIAADSQSGQFRSHDMTRPPGSRFDDCAVPVRNRRCPALLHSRLVDCDVHHCNSRGAGSRCILDDECRQSHDDQLAERLRTCAEAAVPCRRYSSISIGSVKLRHLRLLHDTVGSRCARCRAWARPGQVHRRHRLCSVSSHPGRVTGSAHCRCAAHFFHCIRSCSQCPVMPAHRPPGTSVSPAFRLPRYTRSALTVTFSTLSARWSYRAGESRVAQPTADTSLGVYAGQRNTAGVGGGPTLLTAAPYCCSSPSVVAGRDPGVPRPEVRRARVRVHCESACTGTPAVGGSGIVLLPGTSVAAGTVNAW